MKFNNFLIALIALGILVGVLYGMKSLFYNTDPKQVCPDEWVVHDPTDIFLVNGKAGDPKDYDAVWIKQHCSINQPEKAN